MQDDPSPKAYSYVRWSTPEQGKGHSLQRQLDLANDWAARNGIELDTELTFRDAGVSAFSGLNVTEGALGAFLKAVHDGLISPGSWLLVEALDRLSRQTVRRAARLIEDIVEAGITVVDLSDGGREYSVQSLDRDPFLFIMMALKFVRSNEESLTKGERVHKAFNARRQRFASDAPLDKPLTRQLPGWLRWSDEKKEYELIEERAAIVREIFRRADAGEGQHRITRWLNECGVEPWGVGRRKATQWHRSYVRKILTNPEVIGIYVPHLKRVVDPRTGRKKRTPLPPVAHRFPAVIERELFERAGARIATTAPRGRNIELEAKSVFAGIVKCAQCGASVTRVSKGKHIYLVCSRANALGSHKRQAVPYATAETALRDNIEVLIAAVPRGPAAEEIEQRIEQKDREISELLDEVTEATDELVQTHSAAVRLKLQELEDKLSIARTELNAFQERRMRLSTPTISHRLKELSDAFRCDPFCVKTANHALRASVSKMVLDAEAGKLWLHWVFGDAVSYVGFVSKHGPFARVG